MIVDGLYITELKDIETLQGWRGTSVRGYSEKYHRHIYVSGYYRGKYTFTTDYTYAKYYSLKTAQKHVKELERRTQL